MKPLLDLADAPIFLDHCYEISQLLGDFCSLLFGTGMRWQEASALTVGAVELKRRVIKVIQVEREGEQGITIATDRGKSATSFRDVPLPRRDDDPLILILQRLTEGRALSEWLFVTTRGKRIYQKLAKRQLHKARTNAWNTDQYSVHITPHGLRRGFAQAVQDRGASADQIKRLLGHVRLTGATKHYAEDRLTEAQKIELQPFIADLTWRRTNGKETDRRFENLHPTA